MSSRISSTINAPIANNLSLDSVFKSDIGVNQAFKFSSRSILKL